MATRRGPVALFYPQPTIDVLDKFAVFKTKKSCVRGSGNGGQPSHEETREERTKCVSSVAGGTGERAEWGKMNFLWFLSLSSIGRHHRWIGLTGASSPPPTARRERHL